MTTTGIQESPRTPRATRRNKISLSILVAVGLLAAPLAESAGASATSLQSVNIAGFPGALANHASRTLYILTVEKGAKLKCTGGCLAHWIPVTVKSSVTSVSLGANVKGKIGFVARSASTKQVTFNSYPLYTFAGDSGPKQSHGEGAAFDGGKWYVVKSSSTSVGATPIVRAASSGGATTTTTAKKPPATTTTTAKQPPATTTTTTTMGAGGGGGTTTTTTGGGVGY
jgi:predicted lipoprotein with Yx(FWY)xxD motif